MARYWTGRYGRTLGQAGNGEDEGGQAQERRQREERYRNPKQAIAIGLSEARRKGAKVPPASGLKRRSSSRTRARKPKSARP